MKFRKPILAIILVLSALCLSLLCLTGCDDTDIYANRVKVVFKLEGGTYRSTQSDVVYYLGEKDGTSKKIYDPVSVSGEKMINAEYKFVGWFRDRIEDGDKVVYRNKWDFELDRVGDDGITLYACWRRYTYNVCYRDDDGSLVVLGEYTVSEGEPFEDYDNYASNRTGYTSLDIYRTESGEMWDENFTHPGGDEDLAVNVVVEYLKGDYKLVRTARELRASRNGNIYLMNDIDFGGEKFAGFGNYRGTKRLYDKEFLARLCERQRRTREQFEPRKRRQSQRQKPLGALSFRQRRRGDGRKRQVRKRDFRREHDLHDYGGNIRRASRAHGKELRV